MKYFKKRYDFECPKCGAKLWAKPSMMMTCFGRNSGCGSCLDCGEFLHLEIEGDLKGEKMKAIPWNDFLKREGIGMIK